MLRLPAVQSQNPPLHEGKRALELGIFDVYVTGKSCAIRREPSKKLNENSQDSTSMQTKCRPHSNADYILYIMSSITLFPWDICQLLESSYIPVT